MLNGSEHKMVLLHHPCDLNFLKDVKVLNRVWIPATKVRLGTWNFKLNSLPLM